MCNRKVALKGTVWTTEQSMFVADVGNETITITLSFPTGNEYTMHTLCVTPSHPAMYMNPDGTVDRIPGTRTEFTENGTYTFKKGKLVLNSSEGSTKELDYEGGVLHSNRIFGSDSCIFTRKEQN